MPTPTTPNPTERRFGLLLLPLRLFAGGTFLYAGVYKLLDPTFFDANSSSSIISQLRGFEHVSPLGPLISVVGIPLAVPIGFLMALGEIGIGLGALSGLAFRFAAAGGLAVSLLFWLTASWGISPYFLGPDLPYAAAWLTLLLVGDGGVMRVADTAWFRRLLPLTAPRPPVPAYGVTRRQRAAALQRHEEPSVSRRLVLEAGVLAAASVVVGGAGVLFRRAVKSGSPGIASGPTPAPTTAGTTPAPSNGTAGPTPVATGPQATAAPGVLANVKDVTSAGSLPFTDPVTGDPAVLISLGGGKIIALDAVCTHAGCTVQYVDQYKALLCPCHGAAFDAANGQVLQGPARSPLATLPIKIDPTTGAITLGG
jgi:thiosulfate dehydrogenase [quinone] large subunit